MRHCMVLSSRALLSFFSLLEGNHEPLLCLANAMEGSYKIHRSLRGKVRRANKRFLKIKNVLGKQSTTMHLISSSTTESLVNAGVNPVPKWSLLGQN